MELGQSTSIFLDNALHADKHLLCQKRWKLIAIFVTQQKIISCNRFLILVVCKYFLGRRNTNIQIICEPLTLEIFSDYVITAAQFSPKKNPGIVLK